MASNKTQEQKPQHSHGQRYLNGALSGFVEVRAWKKSWFSLFAPFFPDANIRTIALFYDILHFHSPYVD
jgi:hypothetical protein